MPRHNCCLHTDLRMAPRAVPNYELLPHHHRPVLCSRGIPATHSPTRGSFYRTRGGVQTRARNGHPEGLPLSTDARLRSRPDPSQDRQAGRYQSGEGNASHELAEAPRWSSASSSCDRLSAPKREIAKAGGGRHVREGAEAALGEVGVASGVGNVGQPVLPDCWPVSRRICRRCFPLPNQATGTAR